MLILPKLKSADAWTGFEPISIVVALIEVALKLPYTVVEPITVKTSDKLYLVKFIVPIKTKAEPSLVCKYVALPIVIFHNAMDKFAPNGIVLLLTLLNWKFDNGKLE